MEVTASVIEEVDVICGSLKAKLRVNNLCDGRSRCVLLGETVLTPCDYERSAGIGSKNWKRSIRYLGKPLINFLQCYTNSRGKRCVKFINSKNNRDESLGSRLALSSSQPLLATSHSASMALVNTSLNSALLTDSVAPSTASSTSSSTLVWSSTVSNLTNQLLSSSSLTSIPLSISSSSLCTPVEVPTVSSSSSSISKSLTDSSEPTSKSAAGSSQLATSVSDYTNHTSVASLSDRDLIALATSSETGLAYPVSVSSSNSVSSSLTATSLVVTDCLMTTTPFTSSTSALPISSSSNSNGSEVATVVKSSGGFLMY